MIVCLCHGVTAHEIESHVEDGARTIDELSRRCGAGTDCASCHRDLLGLLDCADDHEPRRRPLPLAAAGATL